MPYGWGGKKQMVCKANWVEKKWNLVQTQLGGEMSCEGQALAHQLL